VSVFAGIAVGAPIAGALIDHAGGQAVLNASIAREPPRRWSRCSLPHRPRLARSRDL
jgi:hypothetical protein